MFNCECIINVNHLFSLRWLFIVLSRLTNELLEIDDNVYQNVECIIFWFILRTNRSKNNTAQQWKCFRLEYSSNVNTLIFYNYNKVTYFTDNLYTELIRPNHDYIEKCKTILIITGNMTDIRNIVLTFS